ncbi:leucine efflux protein LeuE [Streptomyces bambusae]|uniref:leucine efflux protein LeuE n=1 Tax=Streptomyces bambusae TaxID=1550616 RepID=UPI001CFD1884|nr:leucine efflux protein LeuE [Streptomyces bambusae]MCB5164622.1 leucine efflux protein LeuE [Streptomyces bambusae]
MWGTQHLQAFVLGALLVILLPGPSSLGTLTAAAQGGRRAGLRCALGVFAGEVVLMVLTVVGAAHLLRADPQVVTWVRWAGAAYIAWLGVGMLRTARRSAGSGTLRPSTPADIPTAPMTATDGTRTGPGTVAGTRRAFVVTVLNPKAIVFFLSYFLQFVAPSAAHPHVAFAFLGAVYELISVCYQTCLVLAAARIGRAVGGRPQLTAWLRAAAGLVFLGFGAALIAGL